ncbi:hypothetical protein ACJ41O_010432 [Fusarium nematophilum]
MPKHKYYGVRVGRRRGVVRDWQHCAALVKGYPKQCYKGFKTKKEARAFVNSRMPWGDVPVEFHAPARPDPELELESESESEPEPGHKKLVLPLRARQTPGRAVETSSCTEDDSFEDMFGTNDTVRTAGSSSQVADMEASGTVYQDTTEAIAQVIDLLRAHKAVRITPVS